MNVLKMSLATAVTMSAASSVFASAISAGDVVVLQQGDGTSTLANTGNSVALLDYNTSGAVQQTIAIPSTGTSGLLQSGTASSEGAISLAGDGSVITVSGYSPANGTGTTTSLTSSTAAAAPRAYGTVSVATGTYTFGSTYGSNYSANNIRGTTTDGAGNFYGTGGNTGTVYNNGSTNTVIQSTLANTRVDNVINGNLYLSTGSGTQGIYGFTGVPTTATAATAIITGVTGQGTNPYDFTFSPDGKTAYVADATLGIQKFTLSGGVWSLAYNITTASTGVTGLGVNFSGTNPVIYAVNPTTLYTYTDTGVAGAATAIASAVTNDAFRGLEVVPSAAVPEPASLSLLGLGGLTLLRRRRAF